MGLYCVPLLAWSSARVRAAAALACVPAAAFFLSAAQLWTGLDVAAEGVRQGGMSFDFATSYSFPPENLLTLLVPDGFGRIEESRIDYWGRWFYWDASAYFGVIALIFTMHGAVRGDGHLWRLSLLFFPLLMVLALGRYAPVYALLFHGVPGFEFFRAPSKFAFFATLFAAPLVGLGVDRAFQGSRGTRATGALALTLAALLLCGALWTHASAGASWQGSPMAWLASANDGFVPDGEALGGWRMVLLRGFVLSAALASLAGVLLLARGERRPWAIVLLVGMGVAELVTYAYTHHSRTRIPPILVAQSRLPQLYARAGTDRVFEVGLGTNAALQLGGYGIWGYDPLKLDRYAQFLARTQGFEAFDLTRTLEQRPARFHPSFRMLRVRFQAWRTGRVAEHRGALPRFLLVPGHQLADGPEAALAAVMRESFDPREIVVLEGPPRPPPSPSPRPGEIRLLDESTDRVTLEVDAPDAAILLMTDSYARGWRARALPGSVQTDYRLQPADYVLRAIPLAAGRHRLVVEYAPAAFRAGAWVSSLSALVFLGAVAHAWGRTRRRHPARRLVGDR